MNQKDSLPTRELDQIITDHRSLSLRRLVTTVSGADTRGGETFH